VCKVALTQNKEVFLRQTYLVSNNILDGIWYYPIPMNSLCGVCFEMKEEVGAFCTFERRRPWWALLICISGLLLGLLFLLPSEKDKSDMLYIISPVAAAVFLMGVLLFLVLPINQKGSDAWTHVSASRVVKIGFQDPLTQKNTIASCCLESNYPLQDVKYFIAMLQRKSTSDERDSGEY